MNQVTTTLLAALFLLSACGSSADEHTQYCQDEAARINQANEPAPEEYRAQVLALQNKITAFVTELCIAMGADRVAEIDQKLFSPSDENPYEKWTSLANAYAPELTNDISEIQAETSELVATLFSELGIETTG